MIDSEHFGLDHYITPPSESESFEKFSTSGITLESVAKEALREAETKRILEVLRETKGNKTKAAEILQVSYKTLLTKIREYGIEG